MSKFRVIQIFVYLHKCNLGQRQAYAQDMFQSYPNSLMYDSRPFLFLSGPARVSFPHRWEGLKVAFQLMHHLGYSFSLSFYTHTLWLKQEIPP